MSGNLPPSNLLPQHDMCNRKRTTYSRRSSVDPCLMEASFNNVTAEELRKAKYSMPALPSNSLESQQVSSGNKWEHSAQELPRLLATSEIHSSGSNSISLNPPITREVLSELNIPRMENDLNYRHDLNFDSESELRVNTQGPRAEERRERQCEYWHALAAEIAMWLAHYQNHSSSPFCVWSPNARVQSYSSYEPWRLPRFFETMKDILKHLLPYQDWPMIEAVLDVGFIMQQLEHGVNDFVALSDWLSNCLRRFCSPTRDRMLDTMNSAIRSGVENANIDSILYGLMTMLEVLQGMNLVSWSIPSFGR